ncbi:MAG TPA: long-chain fatty acid--CoA ligase [Acidimicrobiales bacterium]|jgi:fatty-acyl-CoA synthase|nr:long-chain fatty acid--CoA ligase [Acidimicrobiales bacterium]
MQDGPLTITGILRHGLFAYADSEVATFEGDHARSATFATVGERAARLASGLARLGIGRSDRVGTFSFNHQEHLEAYLGVPAMGAVLHTLNVRLFPEQLAYVVNHGEDRIILFDGLLAEVLARVIGECRTVEHLVMIGPGDPAPLREAGFTGPITAYEDLLAQGEPEYPWPDLDEREAAAMCYTSGTTGNPKGVVYSHRSTWLHAVLGTSSATTTIGESDRVLVVVPMFHVNAWGTPYSAWMTGADLVMPQRFLQAEPLARMMRDLRPTVSAGVPSIWNDLLHYAEDHEVDLSSLRVVTGGGSAVPRSLIEGFDERFGVTMVQGWGMTETSPVCAVAWPSKHSPPDRRIQERMKAGRIIPGVEARVVGEEGVLPQDGVSEGEFEVRGPWITAAYYKDEDSSRFHDGWLRTGDVGTLDPKGYMQITDRTKDVIKSGGEWISSVELENAIMAHPAVREAAVVGVPDERWQERPLACVVLAEGQQVTAEDLRGFLVERVAKWWLPERWAFITEVPKTSVGKFDKKVLRSGYAKGDLETVTSGGG